MLFPLHPWSRVKTLPSVQHSVGRPAWMLACRQAQISSSGLQEEEQLASLKMPLQSYSYESGVGINTMKPEEGMLFTGSHRGEPQEVV